MSDCIFCKIVVGEIPAQKLFENDQVLAFTDIHPQAPIHCVVIPKKHYSTLEEVPENEMSIAAELYRAARQVARDKSIAAQGYRLAMNVNSEGGQTVFHVHLHLLGGKQMGPSLVG